MTLLKTMGLLLVSVFGLNACVATNTTYSNGSSGGYNTYKPKPTVKPQFTTEGWVLASLNNASYRGPRITLQLSSQKRVSGFSGCNRYFSSTIEVNGNRLRFGTVSSTKKLCTDQNINQLENRYLNVLRSISYFEKSSNRLVLNGDSGSLTFYKKSMR